MRHRYSTGSSRAGRFALVAFVALAAADAWVAPAFADEAAGAADGHHLRLPEVAVRSMADYVTPSVRLTRADGSQVWLADELDDGRPVVLDFIYTTCTSICPLSSQTFSALQERLGTQRDRVHLVSISIDPEQDTPRRLTEYSRHFDAGPQWQFYTGTLNASQAIQQAFRAYRGDKMSHAPLTLFRPAPGSPWIRFDGFATVNALMSELHTQGVVR